MRWFTDEDEAAVPQSGMMEDDTGLAVLVLPDKNAPQVIMK